MWTAPGATERRPSALDLDANGWKLERDANHRGRRVLNIIG